MSVDLNRLIPAPKPSSLRLSTFAPSVSARRQEPRDSPPVPVGGAGPGAGVPAVGCWPRFRPGPPKPRAPLRLSGALRRPGDPAGLPRLWRRVAAAAAPRQLGSEEREPLARHVEPPARPRPRPRPRPQRLRAGGRAPTSVFTAF